MKKIILLITFLFSISSVWGQKTFVKKVTLAGTTELTVPDSLLTIDATKTIRFTRFTDIATKLTPLLSSGGFLSKTGTPLINQFALFTDANTVQGTNILFVNGASAVNTSANLNVGGDLEVSGTLNVVNEFESPGILDQATSKAIVINSNNFVGIGTFAPNAPLSIVENSTTTGATTGVLIQNLGVGDAKINFDVQNTQDWSFGIDNSDGDALKFSHSFNLQTDTAMSIKTTKDIDMFGNLVVTSNITGSNIIKSGGLSTEFLKANGSVDSNTYLTTTGKAADSELLDGIDSTQLLRSDESDTMEGSTSNTGFTIKSPLSGSFYTSHIELLRTGTLGGSKIESIRDASGGVGLSFNVTIDNTAEVNGTYTEAMVLNMAGDLGIGTPTPSEKLEVNGNIKADAFIGPKKLFASIASNFNIVVGQENHIFVIANPGANTITIPTDAAQGIPIGAEITFINDGVGVISFITTGITLNSSIGVTLVQFNRKILTKYGTNTWLLSN